MKINKNILKSISSVIILTLLMSSFTSAGYIPINPKIQVNFGSIMLDPYKGRIVQRFKGKSDKFVVCLQDMHCNREVQNNIVDILTRLRTIYAADFDNIFIEGAWDQDLDTDFFRRLPNGHIKDGILEDLIAKGILTGAEKYVMTAPYDINLSGIENRSLYLKNASLLLDSYKVKEKAVELLELVNSKLAQKKDELFLEDLSKFEKILKKYKNSEISIAQYLNILNRYANFCNINFRSRYPTLERVLIVYNMHFILGKEKDLQDIAYKFEQDIKVRLSAEEIDKLNQLKESYNNKNSNEYYLYLTELIRIHKIPISNKYDLLVKYFKYLEYLADINTQLVQEEEKDLVSDIKMRLAKTKEEIELINLENIITNERNFITNNITPKDAAKVLANKDNLPKEIVRFVDNDYSDVIWFEKIRRLVKNYKKAKKIMRKFYKTADKRNHFFINNTLKQNKKVSVMVTGGFHTKGITDILSSRGISYIVVAPNITEKTNSLIYHKRIEEQEKLVINTLALIPMSQGMTIKKFAEDIEGTAAASVSYQDFIIKKLEEGNYTRTEIREFVEFMYQNKLFTEVDIGFDKIVIDGHVLDLTNIEHDDSELMESLLDKFKGIPRSEALIRTLFRLKSMQDDADSRVKNDEKRHLKQVLEMLKSSDRDTLKIYDMLLEYFENEDDEDDITLTSVMFDVGVSQIYIGVDTVIRNDEEILQNYVVKKVPKKDREENEGEDSDREEAATRVSDEQEDLDVFIRDFYINSFSYIDEDTCRVINKMGEIVLRTRDKRIRDFYSRTLISVLRGIEFLSKISDSADEYVYYIRDKKDSSEYSVVRILGLRQGPIKLEAGLDIGDKKRYLLSKIQNQKEQLNKQLQSIDGELPSKELKKLEIYEQLQRMVRNLPPREFKKIEILADLYREYFDNLNTAGGQIDLYKNDVLTHVESFWIWLLHIDIDINFFERYYINVLRQELDATIAGSDNSIHINWQRVLENLKKNKYSSIINWEAFEINLDSQFKEAENKARAREVVKINWDESILALKQRRKAIIPDDGNCMYNAFIWELCNLISKKENENEDNGFNWVSGFSEFMDMYGLDIKHNWSPVDLRRLVKEYRERGGWFVIPRRSLKYGFYLRSLIAHLVFNDPVFTKMFIDSMMTAFKRLQDAQKIADPNEKERAIDSVVYDFGLNNFPDIKERMLDLSGTPDGESTVRGLLGKPSDPDTDDGQLMEHYITQILNPVNFVWGGNLELEILSRYFKVKIEIKNMQSGQIIRVIGRDEPYTDTITLQFTGTHYDPDIERNGIHMDDYTEEPSAPTQDGDGSDDQDSAGDSAGAPSSGGSSSQSNLETQPPGDTEPGEQEPTSQQEGSTQGISIPTGDQVTVTGRKDEEGRPILIVSQSSTHEQEEEESIIPEDNKLVEEVFLIELIKLIRDKGDRVTVGLTEFRSLFGVMSEKGSYLDVKIDEYRREGQITIRENLRRALRLVESRLRTDDSRRYSAGLTNKDFLTNLSRYFKIKITVRKDRQEEIIGANRNYMYSIPLDFDSYAGEEDVIGDISKEEEEIEVVVVDEDESGSDGEFEEDSDSGEEDEGSGDLNQQVSNLLDNKYPDNEEEALPDMFDDLIEVCIGLMSDEEEEYGEEMQNFMDEVTDLLGKHAGGTLKEDEIHELVEKYKKDDGDASVHGVTQGSGEQEAGRGELTGAIEQQEEDSTSQEKETQLPEGITNLLDGKYPHDETKDLPEQIKGLVEILLPNLISKNDHKRLSGFVNYIVMLLGKSGDISGDIAIAFTMYDTSGNEFGAPGVEAFKFMHSIADRFLIKSMQKDFETITINGKEIVDKEEVEAIITKLNDGLPGCKEGVRVDESDLDIMTGLSWTSKGDIDDLEWSCTKLDLIVFALMQRVYPDDFIDWLVDKHEGPEIGYIKEKLKERGKEWGDLSQDEKKELIQEGDDHANNVNPEKAKEYRTTQLKLKNLILYYKNNSFMSAAKVLEAIKDTDLPESWLNDLAPFINTKTGKKVLVTVDAHNKTLDNAIEAERAAIQATIKEFGERGITITEQDILVVFKGDLEKVNKDTLTKMKNHANQRQGHRFFVCSNTTTDRILESNDEELFELGLELVENRILSFAKYSGHTLVIKGLTKDLIKESKERYPEACNILGVEPFFDMILYTELLYSFYFKQEKDKIRAFQRLDAEIFKRYGIHLSLMQDKFLTDPDFVSTRLFEKHEESDIAAKGIIQTVWLDDGRRFVTVYNPSIDTEKDEGELFLLDKENNVFYVDPNNDLVANDTIINYGIKIPALKRSWVNKIIMAFNILKDARSRINSSSLPVKSKETVLEFIVGWIGGRLRDPDMLTQTDATIIKRIATSA